MANIHAAELGRLGGRTKSLQKANSSRKNGKLGGRPAIVGVTDWIKFFDAVDSCRRYKNFRRLSSLFLSSLRPKEKSLINATTRHLADELNVKVPLWARRPMVLKSPYFVSGVENLKASALVESMPEFRRNNIFVLANFLERV